MYRKKHNSSPELKYHELATEASKASAKNSNQQPKESKNLNPNFKFFEINHTFKRRSNQKLNQELWSSKSSEYNKVYAI